MSAARTLIAIAATGLAALGMAPGRSAAGAQQAQSKNPVVVLETSCGSITLELYPDKAPITVENFLKYVDDGFFNNLLIHRVVPDFVIQGGGMTDQMTEKPTSPPIKNEAGNGLTNQRGAISMARTSALDSATSQFFINLKDNDSLDRMRYAVFGKVIDGMDAVDAIARVPRTTRAGMPDVPVEPIYIKSARRRKG
jgi:peptidyl-prolyl cis-trans isomerase A (cyclophilin A)